jgi:hypothetical protein
VRQSTGEQQRQSKKKEPYKILYSFLRRIINAAILIEMVSYCSECLLKIQALGNVHCYALVENELTKTVLNSTVFNFLRIAPQYTALKYKHDKNLGSLSL